MKLFYRVSPDEYRAKMTRVRERFDLHEEVDEEKTILMADEGSGTGIVKVTGSFDPREDAFAMVKVILDDSSLEAFFNEVFGEPYRKR